MTPFVNGSAFNVFFRTLSLCIFQESTVEEYEESLLEESWQSCLRGAPDVMDASEVVGQECAPDVFNEHSFQ